MTQPEAELPEGTDHIIKGAAETDPATNVADGQKSAFSGFTSQARDTALSLRQQATDKARSYAVDGKDKATGVLDNIAQVVAEAAGSVDEKLGPEYGRYAHQAADAVRSFTDSLRDKDVDQIFDDTKELVRKSPAVAVGIAAVAGFALVRLVKAGTEGRAADGNEGAHGRKRPGGGSSTGG